jgi:sugar phosphate isomerase/epimerase
MEPLAIGAFLVFGENDLRKFERAKKMGFSSAQIIRWPNGYFEGREREDFKKALKDSGIEVTTVFCGYAGETYGSMEAVRRTIGLVPRETRAQRLVETRKIADFAAELGAPRIGAHIGVVPEDAADPLYPEVVEAMKEVCDYCSGLNLQMSLETGQETAPCLVRLIGDVGRDNLKVNFDPANMIAYGSGKPLEVLDVLGKYVVGVHCKDYHSPKEQGRFGGEARLGEGDVNIEAVIKKLWGMGYRGPLTIEREISGEEQWADFAKAKALLEGIRSRLLAGSSS